MPETPWSIGSTITVDNVAKWIRGGAFDSGLVELSNAIEARDEARRTELHERIQEVYGDGYEVVVRKREASERPALGLTRRLAVSPEDIRNLLDVAITNSDVVTIDYTDANGAETTREVFPYGIDSFGRVRARDTAIDEMRTFRLDRISRVES